MSKVVYRLIDPEQYAGQHVLVVGGGDSALEAAASVAECGGGVVLSYRGDAFARAKQANRARVSAAERDGKLKVMLGSNVQQILAEAVSIERQGQVFAVKNDAVIVSAGGVLPTDFLRRVGINVEAKLALRERERTPPRAALLMLGALAAAHIALSAPAPADPLDGVKESIRLKRFGVRQASCSVWLPGQSRRTVSSGNLLSEWAQRSARCSPGASLAGKSGPTGQHPSRSQSRRIAGQAGRPGWRGTRPGVDRSRYETRGALARGPKGDLQVVQALSDRDSVNHAMTSAEAPWLVRHKPGVRM